MALETKSREDGLEYTIVLYLTGPITMGTEPANQNPQISKEAFISCAISPHTSHHLIVRTSRDSVLLDKQIQSPSIFHQERKEGSVVWHGLGQDQTLQPSHLELEARVSLCRDPGEPQELRKSSCSDLGGLLSGESDVLSTRHRSPESCSDISLVGSGYEGDKENSEISLVSSGRVKSLSRRLTGQVNDTETRHLGAAYTPRQLKRRQGGHAEKSQQAGRAKRDQPAGQWGQQPDWQQDSLPSTQASSYQTFRVESTTNVPDDKAQDVVKHSLQTWEDKELPRGVLAAPHRRLATLQRGLPRARDPPLAASLQPAPTVQWARPPPQAHCLATGPSNGP
ncbi:PREDICTED: protein TNT [Elephantulus edwardii]|uniref:protein TNT n=1 Tax=Elephantulus edwardii TaxID=28737 RepID=UPI0003F07EAC|nr:PREDICTED: protein TNT [Elephantulus edwardii]